MKKEFNVVIERKKNQQNEIVVQCRADGRAHEEFVGYITDCVEPWGKMFLEIHLVCSYEFNISDFANKREMISFVKKFAVSFLQHNQAFCERSVFKDSSAITFDSMVRSMEFCIDGFEPVEIFARFEKTLSLRKAVSVAISACLDPNVVDSGVCLDCTEVVAGVWQDDNAEVCPSCDGKRVFNTFTIAFAHFDEKLSALVSK
jgi:hypothetical protein